MSISDFRNLIKGDGGGRFFQDLMFFLIILLVGFASFGLGRLSQKEATKQDIIIRSQESADLASPNSILDVDQNKEESNSEQGRIVASKSGGKYHFPWCAGAQSIKEENKIWFESEAKAAAAGYTAAKNCKGLE